MCIRAVVVTCVAELLLVTVLRQ